MPVLSRDLLHRQIWQECWQHAHTGRISRKILAGEGVDVAYGILIC
jgi:hypothetical protein